MKAETSMHRRLGRLLQKTYDLLHEAGRSLPRQARAPHGVVLEVVDLQELALVVSATAAAADFSTDMNVTLMVPRIASQLGVVREALQRLQEPERCRWLSASWRDRREAVVHEIELVMLGLQKEVSRG